MKNDRKISLASHETCTGCAACASICPTKSISMQWDKEGFLQPQIDAKTCIGCHKCEKTCPIITQIAIPADFETQAYAAINNDETVRMRSSSGGMFHALAKWTIEQGGVVFGARFNEQWEVVHDYTETIEGIEPFMRSKYVQSQIGDTFLQAKQFLKLGRKVLFVGTPCQIGGLLAFLGKEYEGLVTVDVICHGVPSPKVWHRYLAEKVKGETILEINFRDKQDGWKNFQCVTTITTNNATREPQSENLFYRGFMNNVYLRNSCYDCRFKTIHRFADITLADFWGCCPDIDDDKGTSLVFVHTENGKQLLSLLNYGLRIVPQSLEHAIAHNIAMQNSVPKSERRKRFFWWWRLLPFHQTRYFINHDSIFTRIKRKIGNIK